MKQLMTAQHALMTRTIAVASLRAFRAELLS